MLGKAKVNAFSRFLLINNFVTLTAKWTNLCFMPDISANNKRIAKNTVFLYIRMLISLVVTLYTSRVILNVLGVTDFGIYNVVGGVVVLLAFFQSSLSNVVQRYISIALGRKDYQLAELYYRQSITVILCFSVVVLLLGESVGLWFVANKIVIPVERYDAAIWIYHFSLISVFISLNQISLISVIISREKMNFYAYLGLLDAFLKLGIVFFLYLFDCDKLILYGVLMLAVTTIVFIAYFVYCKKNFLECKTKLYWDKELFKDMSKFVGYNIFGCFAYAGSEQGLSIVLNMFYGPTINAAKGISSQVVNSVMKFTDNMMTAFKPQIVKSYASNDLEYMITLIEKSSKFSFFLSAIISFPLILNIEKVLEWWLGIVPEYANSFTVIVLIQCLISTLANPLWIVANATGVIKYNQVYGRLITLTTLPLSYFSLLIYDSPAIAMMWLVITQIGYWCYCLYDIKRQIDLNISMYILNVVKPCLILTLVLSTISIILFFFLCPTNVFGVVCSSLILVIVGIYSVYLLLDKVERTFINDIVRKHLIAG